MDHCARRRIVGDRTCVLVLGPVGRTFSDGVEKLSVIAESETTVLDHGIAGTGKRQLLSHDGHAQSR